MQRLEKVWRLAAHDAAAVRRLARELNCSPVVAQLLINRGFVDATSAVRFLDAPLTGLHPPDTLPGCTDAAGRILRAVRDGRKIVVFGDYDADGVTGTAVLLRTLKAIGADPGFYVPHRLDEGYGLSAEALRQLAADGASVVITVDCGVTAVEEAEEAKRLGLELIVTDHHEPKAELPDAAALVHPNLPGRSAPFGGLSGAAVAFKLAWLLCQLQTGSPKVGKALQAVLLDAVALAAVGVVADVVPLVDENRILVRHGLARLIGRPPLGVAALLEAAKSNTPGALRAETIAFRLAPRLNAAGRLGCARMAVELLTATSTEKARHAAEFIEKQNGERQSVERKIIAEARHQMAEHGGDSPALILADPLWHPGVIGIVAGRLCELFGRPALVIAVRNGVATGSGRSVPGFPLHRALAECGDLLLSHGGHAAAAGFKLAPEQIDEFARRFTLVASEWFPFGPPPPELKLDAEIPLAAITWGLIDAMERLEPYGAGNPRPKFLIGDVEIPGPPRRIGGGERHLMFRAKQGGTSLRAVGWGLGERIEELPAGSRCCLAVTPRVNEFNGQRSIEIEVIDFQPGGTARLGGEPADDGSTVPVQVR